MTERTAPFRLPNSAPRAPLGAFALALLITGGCGSTAKGPTATGGVAGTAGTSFGGHGGSGHSGSGGPMATGGAGQDGGAAGSEQVLGAIGAECAPPGLLGCNGHAQKVALLCSETGKWEINDTCAAGEFCDSTLGRETGTCRASVPECAGAMAGDKFCRDKVLMQCGPDLVTTGPLEECTAACEAASCVNRCGDKPPESAFCDKSTVVQCDALSKEVGAQECAAGCLAGKCLEGDSCPGAEPDVNLYNCSPNCGGQQQCKLSPACVGTVQFAEGKSVVRTPPASYLDSCRTCRRIALAPQLGFRTSVAPPWKLATNQFEPCDEAQWVSCSDVPVWYIVTADAAAPERNVTIEPLEGATACP